MTAAAAAFARKRKALRVTKTAVIYILLSAMALVFLFPFLAMFFKSAMTDFESAGNPAIRFLPTVWDFSGYRHVFDGQMLQWLRNTLVIIVCNMVFIPLSASLVAFGFSKCRFKGRNLLFGLTLATMMIPGTITQIPLYATFSGLGWLNTALPFVVPGLLGGGVVNIFLIRQYMSSIPNTICEAASIDGANKFVLYSRIILPLCFPILVFVIIGAFNGAWNDFMGPLLYLKKPESWTLSLGIYYRYAGASLVPGMFPNAQMATGMLMIIPSALVFFIFQKQIIEGVSTAGIKG